MAQEASNVSFTGAGNQGTQAGQVIGNIETHHHYSHERAETLPEPCLYIPFSRDPDFVDRGTILSQVRERCTAAGAWTALVGLGGIGKSQLAIEYAYRVRDESPETWVFWLHASNASRFEQSLRDIADKAKIFGRKDAKVNIFKLVYDWLQDERRQWLLILDNVDDAGFFQDIVSDQLTGVAPGLRRFRDYLPRRRNGSILITSRSQEAALKLVETRDIISIGPMSETDAQQLFANKLEHLGESEDMAALAAILDFMPLAIVQASAYILHRAPRCPVRQYLEDFQKSDRRRTSLLDFEGGALRRDGDAKNSIIITWQISFEHIQRTMPRAADLLSLMSFFDRAGIPEALLHDTRRQRHVLQATEVHGTDNDTDHEDDGSQSSVDDDFEDSIAILQSYSFVSTDTDSTEFELHGLVQLATRTWLKAHGTLEQWKERYINNLHANFPNVEYENWNKCRALFPHVKSALTQRPKEQDTLRQWATVLHKAAEYADEMGNSDDSTAMATKSMSARQRLFDKESIEMLDSMLLVASVHNSQGRWNEAEELQKRVLEIGHRTLGEEDPRTLESMNALASTYEGKGRWREAEELGKRVIELRRSVLGAEHPKTLVSMKDLAIVYSKQGRWREAIELLGGVIEVEKRILGEEHPETLISISHMVTTTLGQGRWREAEDLGKRVIEISRRVLGEEHPNTLVGKSELVRVFMEQGRLGEAEDLGKQLLEISTRVLGEDHPITLVEIGNLAETYRSQGKPTEAENLEKQLLEKEEKLFGEEHPATITTMGNLALAYDEQGRWDEAERLNKQVLEMRRRVLGEEHPDTLTVMSNLALIYSNQNQWNEAEELDKQVLEMRRRVLGEEHPDTLTSMNNLAATYNYQNRWDEAEELDKQVLELSKRLWGEEHPETLRIISNLAALYNSQGRWYEAEELDEQVLEMRRRVLGEEHPDTLTTMSNLAHAWNGQGRTSDALGLMGECVQLRTRMIGPEHPDTVSSSAFLREWQEKRSKTDD